MTLNVSAENDRIYRGILIRPQDIKGLLQDGLLLWVTSSFVLIHISKGTLKMNERESIFSEAGARYVSSEVIKPPSQTHR